MCQCVSQTNPSAMAPGVAASKRFRRYKREATKRESKADVRTLRGLLKLWDMRDLDYFGLRQRTFPILVERMKPLGCAPDDVERFSILLGELQESAILERAKHLRKSTVTKSDMAHEAAKAGIFLSAMVEASSGESCSVPTRHLEIIPDHLGFRNRKNLKVAGPAGDGTGENMLGGMLTVEGDAGRDLGVCLGGGRIIVEGDARSQAGEAMKNGEIVIHGSAGMRAGLAMRGGRLTIMGDADYELGSVMCGGEIHVHGELIDDPDLIARIGRDLPSIGKVFGGRLIHKGTAIVNKEDLDGKAAAEVISRELYSRYD